MRIYRLRNVDPGTIASTLDEIFGSRPGFQVVPDARTGSVIVRGSEDDLEIAEPLVTELDRDP